MAAIWGVREAHREARLCDQHLDRALIFADARVHALERHEAIARGGAGFGQKDLGHTAATQGPQQLVGTKRLREGRASHGPAG